MYIGHFSFILTPLTLKSDQSYSYEKATKQV